MDTHLHLTRIFLPRRSLSTTSIMRAVAYPSGCVEGVAPRMATSTFCHQFSRNFDGADRQTKFSTVRFGHFERARPSCRPEAPCCSSRCSSGASWAPARKRPCRSVRHPRSPTGARASTRRRHPREKRPHSKRGPNDDSPGELTHHSHPSPSLTNFTGTPGTCARSSRPRRNPTARASWTPPTARHAAASPWRSARPTAR